MEFFFPCSCTFKETFLMDSKANIRQAQVMDAAVLQSLSVDTFSHTYAAYNAEADMQLYIHENFSLSRITEELKDPQTEIYFIGNGDPAGYIKINLHKPILDTTPEKALEIARIYVKHNSQGKGYGRLLLEKAVEIARANHFEYIWLGVWEQNSKAIHFYEKMGFKAAGHHFFQLGKDLQKDAIMKLHI